MDVFQKFRISKLYSFVLVAHAVFEVEEFVIFGSILRKERELLVVFFKGTHITDITHTLVKSLTFEYIHNSFDSIGLILLYLKIELHHITFLTVSLE